MSTGTPRPPMAAWLCCLAGLLATAASCRSATTEIVLRVTTDIPQGPGATLTAVRVRARPAGQSAWQFDRAFPLRGTAGEPCLPAELGLIPREPGTAPAVEIEVTAQVAGGSFVQRVSTRFQEGSVLLLVVPLEQRCVPAGCPTMPGVLLPYTPLPATTSRCSGVDAGRIDAEAIDVEDGADVGADTPDVPAPVDATDGGPADVVDARSDVGTDSARGIDDSCGAGLGACNPVSNAGCTSGQTCAYRGSSFSCVPAGTAGWGQSCIASECRPGFLCLGQVLTFCYKLCCPGDDAACSDPARGGRRGATCSGTVNDTRLRFCVDGADPCAARTSCASCTAASNCGWCRSTRHCASGTSAGPTDRSCSMASWAWVSSQCS